MQERFIDSLSDEAKDRLQTVYENEDAVLLFDKLVYAKGGSCWYVREKKDTINYRSFSTKNFKVARKRFDKYSESVYKKLEILNRG